jgi:hypothetical protein
MEERGVALIYEGDAGYLFGIAHNKTKQVVRGESKTRSEEEAVPSHGYPARVAVPLSTAWRCPASGGWVRRVRSIPHLVAIATSPKTIRCEMAAVEWISRSPVCRATEGSVC